MRYIRRMLKVKHDKDYYTGAHYGLGTAVTTCGILVPALLSLQQTTWGMQLPWLWWCSWSMSLSVGLLQAYMKLFKIEANFLTYKAAYAALKHEGWLFINRSTRYSRDDPEDGSYLSHALLYPQFAEEVERIIQHLKRAELDMAMAGDHHQGAAGTGGSIARRGGAGRVSFGSETRRRSVERRQQRSAASTSHHPPASASADI